MSCDVCCDAFNRSSRSKISCPYCPFSACSGCSERYLLDTTQDAHCMSCRKGWSREILVDNFSFKFISRGYKNRRESLLLEREKSLMPATQPYVEFERNIRKIANDIDQLRQVAAQHNERWAAVHRVPRAVFAVEHGLDNEFDALILQHQMGFEHRKLASNIAIDIEHKEWYRSRLSMQLHGQSAETERRVFVRACPAGDCRGFLSQVWKCGMCDNWTCPDCHEVKGLEKDGPHVCDPNSVETAKMLAKDSRPCPKCASVIFKIDGCDQMFCTQCHTAFSWRTGRVDMGTIHNPHYYEYQRQRGTVPRNPGDVPCGGFPDWIAISNRFPRTHPLYKKIANSHRTYAHCQYIVIPRYTTGIHDNRDMRIKFMIGDVNEDEFKKRIQQREKARQRKTDISQVLDMYMTVINDLFQGFVNDSNCEILSESLTELSKHFNTTMTSISKRYSKCVTPHLSENFDTLL